MARVGFTYTADPQDAAVVIINTCAFIEPAVEESIDAILDAHARNREALLIVAGCLPLRYRDSLGELLPEVGLYVEPHQIPELPRLLESALKSHKTREQPAKTTDSGRGRKKARSSQTSIPSTLKAAPTKARLQRAVTPSGSTSARQGERSGWDERVLTTPGYAYLRIAEGCRRRCRYCTIPSIRGPLKSVGMRELEEEARFLASHGARELVLIAQDLTSYGIDRGEKQGLISLLERIREVQGIRWLRLMYLHPAGIPKGLPKIINESENILPYLDIPFQHVSDTVLKAMGRPWKGDRIRELVERLRSEINGLVLRTTLMVGYPAEGETEFEELRQFVESFAIEHVGVFTYSPEEGTPARHLGDPVPREVKEARAEKIRNLHGRFMKKRNRAKIGSLQECLVEGISEETDLLLQARTWDQAPEVDGILYITAGSAVAGEIRTVKITGAHGADLFGELVPNASDGR